MAWQHHLNFLPLPHGQGAYESIDMGSSRWRRDPFNHIPSEYGNDRTWRAVSRSAGIANELFDQRAGSANVHDMHFAEPRLRGRFQESLLQIDKCRGDIGAHGGPQRLAGVAIQTGWNVHGQNPG